MWRKVKGGKRGLGGEGGKGRIPQSGLTTFIEKYDTLSNNHLTQM